MDFRMDTAFESRGGFSENPDGSSMIHGKLTYAPEKGVELELVENPWEDALFGDGGRPVIDSMFGYLADGTPVTLLDCIITNGTLQLGVGIGAPSTIAANRVFFGQHIPDLDHLAIKKYSVEMSSLSNWTGSSPVTSSVATGDD